MFTLVHLCRTPSHPLISTKSLATPQGALPYVARPQSRKQREARGRPDSRPSRVLAFITYGCAGLLILELVERILKYVLVVEASFRRPDDSQWTIEHESDLNG